MRLSTAFLSAFLMLNLTLAPFVQASSFNDVSTAYKHYSAIVALAGQGVIQGYANKTFQPEKTINRAEAVKVLIGAQFPTTQIQNALTFHFQQGHSYVNLPDVGVGDWFAPYFKVAFQNNIVKGYPDNTFKPGNSINFAEALKVILNSYGVNANSVAFTPSTLLAVKTGDWFAPYFGYAKAYNLINKDKFYHPGQLITRGEFVEIIHRLQQVQATGQPFVGGVTTSGEYTITIPKLNVINQPIAFANPYDADSALALLRSVPFGHYLATPGSGKKFVLYAHSSGYAWDSSPYKVVLRQIDQLNEGDKIYINYQEKGYAYQMTGKNIIPEHQDVNILANENANEMAMYTCWPPDSTTHRYVVTAKPL